MNFVSDNPYLSSILLALALYFVVTSFASVMRGRTDYVSDPGLLDLNSRTCDKDLAGAVTMYTEVHQVGGGSVADRKHKALDMVNAYYDLVTDLYLYGWGHSFHFATRHNGESFDESLRRHEYYLASGLGVGTGDVLLDAGCGVGGPARNIAKFTKARVVGLNNNDYQVRRGNAVAAAEGMSKQVELVKGNFMDIQLEPESFDGAYQIEATCHAPDRTKAFSEIFKVLKPGATFAGYEWVFTDKYDVSNPEHKKIMDGIEVGNGLPDTTPASDVVDALVAAGFDVKVCEDLAPASEVPWYQPFLPDYTLQGFKTSLWGIKATSGLVAGIEAIGLAPKGTAQMHGHLYTAAETLCEAGKLGIFTPMLHFVAVKPAGGRKGAK